MAFPVPEPEPETPRAGARISHDDEDGTDRHDILCEQMEFRHVDELGVLLAICAHLDCPSDLGRLACASSSFGRPIDWKTEGKTVMERRSVVEEHARRWVLAKRLQKFGADRRGDGQTWLRQMHEIKHPTRFTEASEPVMSLSEMGAVATLSIGGNGDRDGRSVTVAAVGAMLAGCTNYAVFTLEVAT
eukprot:COSAG02_NODE_4550_length_5224_cov_94.387512_1_plen_187_part_10